jgi:hypothetical protein
MASSPKPPAASKPPPPISVTAADQAQAARDQRRLEAGRFDFSKTLLAPRNPPPSGMRSTLG